MNGNKRKAAIRSLWCKLPWSELRKFHVRALDELAMPRHHRSAVARFLRWGFLPTTADKTSVTGETPFMKVQQGFLTYHADDWILQRPQWDLDVAEPLAAAVSLCWKDPFVIALRAELLKGIKVVVENLGVDEWTLALEFCPDTFKEKKVLRLHVHAVLSWSKQKRVRSKASFRLAGVVPTHNGQNANPMAFHRSRQTAPAHYYLQMPKIGGVWCGTNVPAFRKFAVNPRWVTTFWQSGHLTLESARSEYVKCKMNLMQNLQNLDVVSREMQASFLADKMRIIQEALTAELCEFRDVPEKAVFLDQFKRIRSRYKFLVLHGESCTGKTIWAKWLFGNPELVLEVNCASCPEPDLREFKPLLHKGILFDEANAEMVLRQRKLFQAPPTSVRLGCSTTNCFAYDVFVSGVAMIIASNTWVSDVKRLKKLEDSRWLHDNAIVVEVGNRPLWKEPSGQ